MPEWKIEPMSPRYTASYGECVGVVAREKKYLLATDTFTHEETEAWVNSALERESSFFVAWDGIRVIGWCDVVRHERPMVRHRGRLGMGVLPALRGKGIGSALMKASLDHAKSRGIERVDLEVFASNKRAQGLYKKFGFEVEGVMKKAKKLDGEYEDIICMGLLF